MYKYILPVVLTGLFSVDVTLASEGQQQAESFAEQRQTEANGLVKTTAYEWSNPGATRKMLFMLSTASSDTAQLQVFGSVSIIRE